MTPVRKLLENATTYPFRGRGPFVLGWMAIVLWALTLVTLVPGILTIVLCITLSVLAAAYFLVYSTSVIAATCEGENEPPRWADAGQDYLEMLRPIGCTLLLAVACFGVPYVLARMVGADPVARWVVTLLGVGYFPAAFSELAATRSMRATLPDIVVPVMMRDKRLALLAIGMLLAFVLAMIVASWFQTRVPFIGGAVAAVLIAYSAIVTARVLGLVRRAVARP